MLLPKILCIKAAPWLVVYEGDDDAAAAEAAAAEAAAKAAEEEAKKGKTGDDDAPKFTQAQLNKILADEKRKHQKQVETQVRELENLKKAKGLTDKERETLATRIEELNNSVLTKEELSRKEQERLKNEHKLKLEEATRERDDWRNRYTHATITRTITDEAVAAEAYSPSQIVALLSGSTRLVEVLDADGNVVPGQHEVKIKMSDKDKEGKPTTLDLTVKEALKTMKERVEDFGNLFKSGVAGGLGDSKSRTAGREVDPSTMTPEQYRVYRKKRGW